MVGLTACMRAHLEVFRLYISKFHQPLLREYKSVKMIQVIMVAVLMECKSMLTQLLRKRVRLHPCRHCRRLIQEAQCRQYIAIANVARYFYATNTPFRQSKHP